MKKENLEAAKAFFKKNPEVNKVYFTTDGNMFRALHYAENWQKGLGAGEIEHINSDLETDKVAEPKDGAVNDLVDGVITDEKNVKLVDEKDAANDEKAELVKRYIETFDTKPDGLTDEEILAAINAKEVEPIDDKGTADEKAEKAAVKARYVELFNKQPVGKSFDKIKEAIAQKEAEVNAAK